MQVKALRMLIMAALVGAGVIWGERVLAAVDLTSAGDLEANPAVHFAAAYALSLLAFAACPAIRRGDLAKLCVAGGVLLCVIRAVAWREDMTGAVVGEGLGAAAAVLPSSLERLRAALRACPDTIVSMRHPSERRRSLRSRRGPIFSQDFAQG